MKPQALSVGDVDGNGRADIVVSHGVSRFLSVFLNSSTDAGTSFNAQIKLVYTGRNPSALAVQDIDQDGRADIVVANSGAGTISVPAQPRLRHVPSGDHLRPRQPAAPQNRRPRPR
jgi:hypothetical protein